VGHRADLPSAFLLPTRALLRAAGRRSLAHPSAANVRVPAWQPGRPARPRRPGRCPQSGPTPGRTAVVAPAPWRPQWHKLDRRSSLRRALSQPRHRFPSQVPPWTLPQRLPGAVHHGRSDPGQHPGLKARLRRKPFRGELERAAVHPNPLAPWTGPGLAGTHRSFPPHDAQMGPNGRAEARSRSWALRHGFDREECLRSIKPGRAGAAS
jgi:hypothetical protein